MKCPHCPAEVEPGAECAYCGRIAPAASPRTYDPEDVEIRMEPAVEYVRDDGAGAEAWLFISGVESQSVRITHFAHRLHDGRMLWLRGAINPFTRRAHIFHRGFILDENGEQCGEVDAEKHCPGFVWEFVMELHRANA